MVNMRERHFRKNALRDISMLLFLYGRVFLKALGEGKLRRRVALGSVVLLNWGQFLKVSGDKVASWPNEFHQLFFWFEDWRYIVKTSVCKSLVGQDFWAFLTFSQFDIPAYVITNLKGSVEICKYAFSYFYKGWFLDIFFHFPF